MKSRLLVAAVAFLGYAIIDGSTASATDRFYINNASTAWATAGNWETACLSLFQLSTGSGWKPV